MLLPIFSRAVLERGKGRDYYDFIFLSGITDPDFGYLEMKIAITNYSELYERIPESCKTTDFDKKSRDFETLVFDTEETRKRILIKRTYKSQLTHNNK